MPEEKFVLAAQCNCTQHAVDQMGLDGVLKAIRDAVDAAQLDIVILGGEEIPEVYRAVTAGGTGSEVFLWYAALSDNPELKPEQQVVNHRGGRSAGWGSAEKQAEIGENFSFACPNHPEVQHTVLARLERLLSDYPFDGVFLDKIRFPSPANGLDDVLSCFCPHCKALAAAEGLDLDKVQAVLHRAQSVRSGGIVVNDDHPDWLTALLGALPAADQELLQGFLAFRARSITRLTEQIKTLTTRMGVKLSLDLFSPGLAYLVGQDYPAMSATAVWIKPMVYQYANGPAGLRLEIPQLARGLAEFLKVGLDEADAWMQAHLPEMAGSSIVAIERDCAPLELIRTETAAAVARSALKPVYLGIEAVSIPAFHINITPAHVREMVALARACGARGAVLSWDLLHMPVENLRAARS